MKYLIIALIATNLMWLTIAAPAQAFVPYYKVTDVTQNVISSPQWFTSADELEQFIDQYPLRRGGDCDDIAEEIMLDALEQGKLLVVCPVWKSKVFGEKVAGYKWTSKRHIGLWTWIDNDFYYYEFQTGEIYKLRRTTRD